MFYAILSMMHTNLVLALHPLLAAPHCSLWEYSALEGASWLLCTVSGDDLQSATNRIACRCSGPAVALRRLRKRSTVFATGQSSLLPFRDSSSFLFSKILPFDHIYV